MTNRTIERDSANNGKNTGIGKGNPPAETRFKAGNPGRPKGSRNRATVFRDALSDSDAIKIVRAVVKKAQRGDMVAAKLVLDRLWPCSKGRTVELTLPPTNDAKGIMEAHRALVQLFANGTLTADEAEAVSRLLATQIRALEAEEVERRLTTLEAASHAQQQKF